MKFISFSIFNEVNNITGVFLMIRKIKLNVILFALKSLKECDKKQLDVIRWVYMNDSTCGFGNRNETLEMMLGLVEARQQRNDYKNVYDMFC